MDTDKKQDATKLISLKQGLEGILELKKKEIELWDKMHKISGFYEENLVSSKATAYDLIETIGGYSMQISKIESSKNE